MITSLKNRRSRAFLFFEAKITFMPAFLKHVVRRLILLSIEDSPGAQPQSTQAARPDQSSYNILRRVTANPIINFV